MALFQVYETAIWNPGAGARIECLTIPVSTIEGAGLPVPDDEETLRHVVEVLGLNPGPSLYGDKQLAGYLEAGLRVAARRQDAGGMGGVARPSSDSARWLAWSVIRDAQVPVAASPVQSDQIGSLMQGAKATVAFGSPTVTAGVFGAGLVVLISATVFGLVVIYIALPVAQWTGQRIVEELDRRFG